MTTETAAPRALEAPDDLGLPPELAALRTRVALARTGRTNVIRLAGDHARDAALALLPSRLFLRDAQALPSLFLDVKGHPFAEVTAAADDDTFLLFVDGPSRAATLEHVRDSLPEQQRPDIVDVSETHEIVSVHGPWAWELVSEVLGPDMTALPYLNFFRIDDGLVLRAGRTGEYGYEILVARDKSDALRGRILEKGAAYGLIEVGCETLAHAGFENWFFDPDHVPPGVTPIELQLQWRLERGRAYIGSDAVEARRAELDTPKLACVLSSGELAAGDAIHLGERRVGVVVRSAFSHARGAWFASALVEPPLIHGGITQLTARDASVTLATVAPPLLDNHSLHVDPRRHTYRAREEVKLGPLVRGPLTLAMAEALSGQTAAPASGQPA